MKIVIASSGKNEDSTVSSISGRAPYFLIYENKKLKNNQKSFCNWTWRRMCLPKMWI